jgi:hypothetical protein
MTTVTVTEVIEIRRPIDVVRAHYSDVQHHADHHVHAAYVVRVLSQHASGCTFEQRSKMFGRERVDLYELHRRADGAVCSTATSGPSKGVATLVSFRALGDDSTEVRFEVTVPLPGLAGLFAPLVRRRARAETRAVLQEDRHDLEVRRYQPRP